jgi:hypothetical protein
MTESEHKRRKRRAARALRIAVLVLAIVAMLGVSAASASPAHFHAKPPVSGCDLCLNAHVTAEQAKPAVCFFDIPELHVRFVPGIAAAGYQLLSGSATLTRGPPSLIP